MSWLRRAGVGLVDALDANYTPRYSDDVVLRAKRQLEAALRRTDDHAEALEDLRRVRQHVLIWLGPQLAHSPEANQGEQALKSLDVAEGLLTSLWGDE